MCVSSEHIAEHGLSSGGFLESLAFTNAGLVGSHPGENPRDTCHRSVFTGSRISGSGLFEPGRIRGAAKAGDKRLKICFMPYFLKPRLSDRSRFHGY
jgi:hypothetical protein